MSEPTLREGLRRHYAREIWILAVALILYLLPWLLGVTVGIWLLWQQGWGWGWHWWMGTLVLVVSGMLLARRAFRRSRPPLISPPACDAAASLAEQRARIALKGLVEPLAAEDLKDAESVKALVLRTFHTVATAYAPGDSTALWRFTVPELLLMVEDLARALREDLLREVPVLRHVALRWAAKLYDLAGPAKVVFRLWRVLRLINPVDALIAELRGHFTGQILEGLGETSKRQIGYRPKARVR